MQPAAFFRVEGTLLSKSSLMAAAWMAGNGQHIRGRLARLGAVALAAPLALRSTGMATQAGWSALRGTTEDRLRVLGEEYWHGVLHKSTLPVGLRLLEQARDAGQHIVLISDHPHCIARHMTSVLGAHSLLCNHLEVVKGETTGTLLKPIISGPLSGQWTRDWASQHDIDLLASGGYGARGDDAVLLSAVGHPCAVRPDNALRRTATDLSWPVVDA
ncbi:MAG: phosphoserine phosphatase [Myxococcota bacterium]|jgi:phosphoserine phosphatase